MNRPVGRPLPLPSARIDVRRFGAVGNGVVDDTAKLLLAIDEANTSGDWLFWPKGIYRITSTITKTLSQMRWVCDGAKILVDTGSDVDYGVNLTLGASGNHQLLGNGLEVDANGICHVGLQFAQTNGTHTATLAVDKLVVRNTEMRVGFETASSGIQVRGGYQRVTLRDCEAHDIRMRSGAGVEGLRGVTGILVLGLSATPGAYAREVLISRPVVSDVLSDDATYQHDMDGIGVFGNPALDVSKGPSEVTIECGIFSDCWGRDIKTQTSRTVVRGHSSSRATGPTGGAINPAIDVQTGKSRIEGVHFVINGVDSSRLVSLAGAVEAGPISHRWSGGAVEIKGGATVDSVVSISMPLQTGSATISGVSVDGSAREFAEVSTNGFDKSLVSLSDIVCDALTGSLVRVVSKSGGSAPYRARVVASNCVNLGTQAPTVVMNVSGSAAQALLSESNCHGFNDAITRILTNATTLSGTKFENEQRFAVPLDGGGNSGGDRLLSFAMNDLEERELPSHGFGLNYMAFLNFGVNRQTRAILAVDGSGITQIDAGTSVELGTTTDPGTGSFRIWRKDATSQLVVKNASGSLRICTVRLLG